MKEYQAASLSNTVTVTVTFRYYSTSRNSEFVILHFGNGIPTGHHAQKSDGIEKPRLKYFSESIFKYLRLVW